MGPKAAVFREAAAVAISAHSKSDFFSRRPHKNPASKLSPAPVGSIGSISYIPKSKLSVLEYIVLPFLPFFTTINSSLLFKNSFLTADISELRIGSKFTVSELTNGKFTILHPETSVVVQVRTARAAVEDEVEDEEEGEEGEEGTGEEGAAEEGAAATE